MQRKQKQHQVEKEDPKQEQQKNEETRRKHEQEDYPTDTEAHADHVIINVESYPPPSTASNVTNNSIPRHYITDIINSIGVAAGSYRPISGMDYIAHAHLF